MAEPPLLQRPTAGLDFPYPSAIALYSEGEEQVGVFDFEVKFIAVVPDVVVSLLCLIYLKIFYGNKR